MRKDRNTFFQESQMYNSGFIPNNNMAYPNNMNMQMPYTQGGFSNSYYYGPNGNNMNNNLENKLLKMERQIHQLETRVSKLESLSNTTTTTEDIELNNSSMYMI